MGALLSSSEISDIKPELKFCKRDKPDVVFKHDDAPAKVSEIDHIRSAKRFVFVAHGFRGNINSEYLYILKKAIFDFEKANEKEESIVVIVGWGGGADLRDGRYRNAIYNSQAVGAWLGHIVKTIWSWSQGLPPQATAPSPPPDIIGIGISLGAHLMGAAGRTSQVFDVIIGLDPAGPLFETMNHDKRLKKEDAKFVQVIHTDGYFTGPHKGFSHYGTMEPLGHVDFYPNWGYEQPGLESAVYASHARVVELFIWSIKNPGKFLTNRKLVRRPEAKKKPEMKFTESETTAEMGYHASRNLEGCYVIRTNDKSPWNFESGPPDPKL